MTRTTRFVVWMAALLASVGPLVLIPARAQAPAVVWEWIPLPPDDDAAVSVAVKPGLAGDTLYFTHLGLWQLAPGDTAWVQLRGYAAPFTEIVLVASTGYLFVAGSAGAGSGVSRSTDGGQTWTDAPESQIPGGVTCLYERPADGALFACLRGGGLRWSTDGGATWRPRGDIVDRHTQGQAMLALPGGRLASNTRNGLAYSDDDGQAWTRSNVWEEFSWYGRDLEVGPDGEAKAASSNFGQVILSSADGAIWEERSRLTGYNLSLLNGPDGALWAGSEAVNPETNQAIGSVYRSEDGGWTWAEVADGLDGTCVSDLDAGSDGRLYAATCNGVYRTREPLPVASEPALPEDSGVLLDVRPNPSPGGATVALTLPAPAAVDVAVFDGLGRRVAGLRLGTLAAGSHEWALDTSALAAGRYVVRVTGRSAADAAWELSRPLTLLR